MVPRKGLLVCFLAALQFTTAQEENTTLWPTHSYKSSNAIPPILAITRNDHAPCHIAPGYVFFAPGGTPALNPNSAPYIMDPNNGDLIWAGPDDVSAFGFGMHTYRGEKVLAAWNGTNFREPVGRGNGVVYIWNKHYELIDTVSLPGNFAELEPGVRYPSNIDLHEIYITEKGTMLVTANNVTQTDLTSVGGKEDGWVTEAQFYEIDIETNEVLFEWKSLDHLDQIPLTASVYPLGSEGYDGRNQSLAWGYFHHNAVSPYPGGGFIVSSRYLCSAVVIGKDGKVLWRLQGRDGNGFSLGPGTKFCYQHHIRVVDYKESANGTIEHVRLQLHDNANCPIDNGKVPSSGKVLDVDLNTKSVSLVQEYRNETGPIYANAQGSFQRLPNGNVFEGHGWVPVIEEFSPDGEILSTIQFGDTPLVPGGGFNSSETTGVTLSYRSFKHEWVGCPKTKPSVKVERMRVYVSWNGATEVQAWEVRGGADAGNLKHLTTAKRAGFETAIDIKGDVEVVQVRPVLKKGAPKNCGQEAISKVVSVGG